MAETACAVYVRIKNLLLDPAHVHAPCVLFGSDSNYTALETYEETFNNCATTTPVKLSVVIAVKDLYGDVYRTDQHVCCSNVSGLLYQKTKLPAELHTGLP